MEKKTFFKNDPRPRAMPKHLFLARFEPVVAHFGLPKIPKCLENGLPCDQKWVEKGLKMCFPKKHSDGAFGVPKQVKYAQFQPIVNHFGPSKVTKCLERGVFFWTKKKWIKNGSKMCFSKNNVGPLGVHKRVKCAYSEPILSNFGPS